MKHPLPTTKLAYAKALRTAQATVLRNFQKRVTMSGRSSTVESLLEELTQAVQIAEQDVKDLDDLTRASDRDLLDSEINAALTGTWTAGGGK